jgi:hypothetical protein
MRTITFPNVTPEQWSELKVNVTKDAGLVLAGDEGESSAKGIKYSYKYDPSVQTLTITELSRSFYDPSEDTIAAKLHDGIANELAKKD